MNQCKNEGIKNMKLSNRILFIPHSPFKGKKTSEKWEMLEDIILVNP